jgi:hypothetical protein
MKDAGEVIKRPRRSSYSGLEAPWERRASVPGLVIRRGRQLADLHDRLAAVIAGFHRNTAGQRTTNIIGDNAEYTQKTL